jgi:hypothetical protein
MSSTARARLREGYVTGLLSGLSSIRDMVVAGLLCFGLTHSCRLMKQGEAGEPWRERLANAPVGGYLAVDFIKVEHEGEHIEGVDRQFTHEGIIWGQRFTTSALVFTGGQDPMVLRADAAPSERMATEDYPYLTASEAMMNVTGDVLLSGYELKGMLVDAEFTSKLTLRSLPHFPVGIIGRFRSSTRVEHEGRCLQAKVLAENYRPGKARYYRRLCLYAKRLTVLLPEVGKLDLIFVWYPHTTGFTLSILVSTIKAGLQELIKAFKARWGLEVMHRLLRQNLSLAKCQCLAFAAQLSHFDFCIDALHHIRFMRSRDPSLSWKQARKLTARHARNTMLTELNRRAA